MESTLRPPSLILRLCSGQAAGSCSGLTPSTSLRASSERRHSTKLMALSLSKGLSTLSLKASVRLNSRRSIGAVERVN